MYPMFIGTPGAGKGTQARLLAQRLHVPHISAGNLLRATAARGGHQAAVIGAKLDSGEIITDSFVMALIESRLSQPDCVLGAVLDGCVRTLEQAVALDRIIADRGGVIRVIVLHLSDRVAGARLAARSSLAAIRPSADTQHSARHSQRSDDDATVIPKRQLLYKSITEPIIDYYRARSPVIDIDADQPIMVIHAQIIQALGLEHADLGLATLTHYRAWTSLRTPASRSRKESFSTSLAFSLMGNVDPSEVSTFIDASNDPVRAESI
jgi:adenylate kinase